MDNPTADVRDQESVDIGTLITGDRCQCSGEIGRNLVVCIDGTSNQFGRKNTNVIELYSLLNKDDKQVTFYNSGIGTYAKPSWRSWRYYKQAFYHQVDLAIAWNFEEIVLLAYQWLSDNYKENDRIFLFGFSRGAYQVRCLSAMIQYVGLIHRGNEAQIPFAYELYADIGEDRESPEMATHFKTTFSRDVRIHFVGACYRDTVSSVGVIRSKTLPGTTSGMKHVCFFRHALALDESRVKFLPEFAYRGSTLPPPDSGKLAAHADATSEPLHTKEVWFSGTHSDIGGGSTVNISMDRSDPPLRWMSYDPIHAGLRMKAFGREWDLKPTVAIHESLGWGWWPLEFFFWRRPTYLSPDDTTWWPHLGEGRIICPGQRVHSSVLSSLGLVAPKASLEVVHSTLENHSITWDEVFESKLQGPFPDFIELDLYDRAEQLIHRLSWDTVVGYSISDLENDFLEMVSSADGSRAVREVPTLYASLRKMVDSSLPIGSQALVMRTILEWCMAGRLPIPRNNFVAVAGPLLSAGSEQDHVELVRFFERSRLNTPESSQGRLAIFSPNLRKVGTIKGSTVCIYETALPNEKPRKLLNILTDHHFHVTFLAFSPDAGYLVSLCPDGTIYLWGAEISGIPRMVIRDLGAVSAVCSVDGNLVASSSLDGVIVVSVITNGHTDHTSLVGHTSAITSLLFSYDSTFLASGSFDCTIRIWNTSVPIPNAVGHRLLAGHTAAISSIAISPDNHRLVSGSHDCTVRIWDVANGETLVRIMHGHVSWIVSVAFSPDGARIASMLNDSSMRIWNAQTGRAITSSMQLSEESSSSVSFSPDGERIVCGLNGGPGIIHSTKVLSENVPRVLYGHTDALTTLSFSPDGTRIAFGSRDGKIFVWDVRHGTESIRPIEGHSGVVRSVRFSPDGRLLASGSQDKTIRLWETTAGRQMGRTLEGHVRAVSAVEFSPDSKSIVSGSEDGTVRTWDLNTGAQTLQMRERTAGAVRSVKYSPNGRYIFSGEVDGTICIYDARTGKPEGRPFSGYDDGSVNSLSVSPDGTQIASGANGGNIRIRHTKTGQQVTKTWGDHSGSVLSVAYSPDGSRIASGSQDKTVRVLDVETGRNVFNPLTGHTNTVRSVAFSPDGRHIASASEDRTVRLWNAKTGEPISFN